MLVYIPPIISLFIYLLTFMPWSSLSCFSTAKRLMRIINFWNFCCFYASVLIRRITEPAVRLSVRFPMRGFEIEYENAYKTENYWTFLRLSATGVPIFNWKVRGRSGLRPEVTKSACFLVFLNVSPSCPQLLAPRVLWYNNNKSM